MDGYFFGEGPEEDALYEAHEDAHVGEEVPDLHGGPVVAQHGVELHGADEVLLRNKGEEPQQAQIRKERVAAREQHARGVEGVEQAELLTQRAGGRGEGDLGALGICGPSYNDDDGDGSQTVYDVHDGDGDDDDDEDDQPPRRPSKCTRNSIQRRDVPGPSSSSIRQLNPCACPFAPSGVLPPPGLPTPPSSTARPSAGLTSTPA